jgi:predicted Zn-dependent protease
VKQRSVRRLAPLLVALPAWGLGCALNPATGRPELVLMSEQRELELGAREAEQVAQEMGIVSDPALESYVDAVGQRLARVSPRRELKYEFQVVNMPEPNAFALPGGHVYVSRGLLAIANDEDELANVVGHEVGHVAARHAATRETRALGVGILSALGTLAAGAIAGGSAAQVVGQLGQLAGAGLIASYSRGQEREADLLGQRYAAAAGFDPQGMPRLLRTLEAEVELEQGGKRRPSFFDSHPSTPERVADASARAGSLTWTRVPPIAATRRDFLRRLQGLLLGPDPAEGVLRGSRFLHPALGFALQFPEGWKTQNSRAAVAALAPREDAILLLESQGPGADPRQAANAFVEKNRLQLEQSGALRIGTLDAFRAQGVVDTQSGSRGLDLTWIAYGGTIYRLAGISTASAYRGYQAEFLAVARSFGPLGAADRESVTERRLDFAEARAGETLAAFGARTGNAWSVKETAVANALAEDARLQAGQLVKIARERPYRPTAGQP